MSVRRIDTDSDWNRGRGRNDYLRLSEEIKQNVKTRVQMWKNDCFFALDEGVDWNRFLTKSREELLVNDIRRVIVQTAGVAELTNVEFELLNRNLRCEYTIIDIYSNTWEDKINLLGFENA